MPHTHRLHEHLAAQADVVFHHGARHNAAAVLVDALVRGLVGRVHVPVDGAFSVRPRKGQQAKNEIERSVCTCVLCVYRRGSVVSRRHNEVGAVCVTVG